MEINICDIIHRYIKANFINQTQLAASIGTSKTNLSGRLKGNSMDSSMIYNISVALNHDFFAYFSQSLNNKEINLTDILSVKTKPLTQKQNEEYLLNRFNKMMDEKLKDVKNNMVDKNEVRAQINEMKDQIEEIELHFQQKTKKIPKLSSTFYTDTKPGEHVLNETSEKYKPKK